MYKKIIGILIFISLTSIVLSTNTLSSEQEKIIVNSDYPCIFGTILLDDSIDKDVEIYETIIGDIPETWDWRNVDSKDWTTPIRNQFQDICGSCWAFGALAGLESYIKIWINDSTADVDLSEQYMLSCSPGDCNGWYWTSTLKWLKENGAIPESCLIYEADDTIPCDNKCSDWKEHLVGIDGYHKVSSNVTVIKSALIQYGPLPCTMYVYEDFYPNYSGGVYQYTWGDFVFGHCVAIVGYDDTWGGEDEGYWIVKNSWGTEWGEDGWFRIAYGECNMEKGVYYYTGPNFPADKPDKPTGPLKGVPGKIYSYSAICIDPDEDNIKYCFDWGDGNTSWTDFVNSATSVSVNYTWIKKGSYEVRVKAQDEHGLQSAWSDPLVVTMPKDKTYNISFLKLLQKQLSFFPIINLIIERLDL
ncbi:hypothetical protein AYK24_08625 [Thermoplasmatales archaeon SG8-52-4]|nr:MAG: hypothetical protein AYK24_08625 [Thermoplasmatales archaeon SG8-52-4]